MAPFSFPHDGQAVGKPVLQFAHAANNEIRPRRLLRDHHRASGIGHGAGFRVAFTHRSVRRRGCRRRNGVHRLPPRHARAKHPQYRRLFVRRFRGNHVLLRRLLIPHQRGDRRAAEGQDNIGARRWRAGNHPRGLARRRHSYESPLGRQFWAVE